MRADERPVFPLSAVLLPGGRMDLRIFERRYLDMIGECGRSNCGFIVALIVEGRDSGEPAIPARIGCEALIEDFWTLPDGLLGIRARGGRRARIEEVRSRDNGLLIGRIDWLAEPAAEVLPPEFGLLSTLVRRIADRSESDLAGTDARNFDDSAWVAWALANELPLAPGERQRILQEDEPRQRLELLLTWLPRFATD